MLNMALSTTRSSEMFHLGSMFMETAWGKPQVVDGGSVLTESLLSVVQATNDYMTNHVYVDEAFQDVREKCRNEHMLCSYWAATGTYSCCPI